MEHDKYEKAVSTDIRNYGRKIIDLNTPDGEKLILWFGEQFKANPDLWRDQIERNPILRSRLLPEGGQG